jgi:hypothetical protein
VYAREVLRGDRFIAALAEEVRVAWHTGQRHLSGFHGQLVFADPNREGKVRSKMLSPYDVATRIRTIVTQEPTALSAKLFCAPRKSRNAARG